MQNYPSPFNPTTSIKYYLPKKDKVTLEILDITGRIVAILINNYENSGEHTITFDGSGLASGVYLYRIFTSNGFSQTKKLMLIRQVGPHREDSGNRYRIYDQYYNFSYAELILPANKALFPAHTLKTSINNFTANTPDKMLAQSIKQ